MRRFRDPHATDLENQLGCFLEEIEPQVVEAVIELRKKGYCTIGSGFAGEYSKQYMQWFSSCPEDAAVPSEVGKYFQSMGFTINHRISRWPTGDHRLDYSHAFYLIKHQDMPLDEWRDAWNAFAESMPDLGRKVLPCHTPIAQRFRYDYVELSYKRHFLR